jgi:tetratricopeptide (TPR) repeat protein
MPNLAGRVRNNRLWGVLAVYLGASWVILQIVDVVKQNLGLPDWVFPFAMLLLLIGLPIILATAFLQGGARLEVEAAPPGPSEAAPVAASAGSGLERTGHRFFTWRNALIGGGLAFLLLVAVTGGFMYMRTAGIGPVGSLVAKGVLEERSRIVLAEFEAPDSVLARTVTESFRVDLAQSPVVELVEPDSIANALARMDRAEGTRLTEETARELAVRDGIPAVVAGELAALGAGYVLTARLVAPGDGALLASARASARDDAALLDAIDEVSSKLRERIGESYSSLRATPSLAHVTTGSLEALKKYTQAQDVRLRGGNPEAALQLLEEAVAIDSTFALAWRDIATILGNSGGSWADRIDATERAYRFRARLSERERYLVEASYYQEVTDEPHKVIETYEAMLRLDPEDSQALNNIGFTYYRRRTGRTRWNGTGARTRRRPMFPCTWRTSRPRRRISGTSVRPTPCTPCWTRSPRIPTGTSGAPGTCGRRVTRRHPAPRSRRCCGNTGAGPPRPAGRGSAWRPSTSCTDGSRGRRRPCAPSPRG